MTRAALQRLLDVAVLRRQITAAQAARVLAAYDAGTLDVDRIAATPAETAALVAVELVTQPERPRQGGGGYIYDPATRRYVTIMHANGYESRYGHLSKQTVKEGDKIAKGQEIGRIGSTGQSTGAHLHLELRKNGEL